MLDFIREYQLDIMLVLIGICGITTFFVMISGTLSRSRKRALLLVELYSTILLISDRFAYTFRGDASELGYWMVRISNYLVFCMTLAITHAINLYTYDILMNEGGLKKAPARTRFSEFLFFIGQVLLIISQFTGLYYSFDETNHYIRSPFFLISYIIPTIIMLIQLSLIIQYHSSLRKLMAYPLILFLTVPLIASFIQFFTYGISLINMSIVGMAVILFALVLLDMNVTALGEDDTKDIYAVLSGDQVALTNKRSADQGFSSRCSKSIFIPIPVSITPPSMHALFSYTLPKRFPT